MTDLTQRRKLLVLAICCMSLFIVGLDLTIVNLALPSIGRSFGAEVSGLQWTIDAYTLVLASLLMLAGSTADRIGRKRTFVTGLVVFTIGSLLCSLAPGLGWLIVFRMLQAVGGSMLNPVAMSIITNTFTERRERAQAIGVWGGVVGLSMAMGPVLGGLLVGSVGWRSIFWINIPIGLIAAFATLRFVPESRAPHPRRPDPIGQVIILVMLASLTYAIIEGPGRGWTSPLIVGLFTVSAAALLLLLWYEPRRAEPLIDLRFFRSVPFSSATAIAVAAFAGLNGFLFLNTIYLQEARGLSAVHAGLYTLPMAVVTAVSAPISGRIVGSRGPRLPLLVAGLGMTIAAVMLTGLAMDTSTGWLFLTYVVFGLGFGVVNAPITNAAVSGMPMAQAGVASAVASTSRQIGASLGVAVVGAAATSGLHGDIATNFADASHVGWVIIAGCGLIVLILGQLSTSAWARRTASRTARELVDEPAELASMSA
jgi:EmrB/QacA subfamily drug resistance transporter